MQRKQMTLFSSENNFLPSLNSLKKTLAILITLSIFMLLAINSMAQSENLHISDQDSHENFENINYGYPFMKGEHLFHAGEFLAAKPFFHEYIKETERGEKRLKAFFRLGMIDQNVKSYLTALRFYKMILESRPNYILAEEIKFNMAVCNLEIGNLGAAEELFESIIPKFLIFPKFCLYLDLVLIL